METVETEQTTLITGDEDEGAVVYTHEEILELQQQNRRFAELLGQARRELMRASEQVRHLKKYKRNARKAMRQLQRAYTLRLRELDLERTMVNVLTHPRNPMRVEDPLLMMVRSQVREIEQLQRRIEELQRETGASGEE